MYGSERILCDFNPKLFSFAALDHIFAAARAHSPSVSVHDGTLPFRPSRFSR